MGEDFLGENFEGDSSSNPQDFFLREGLSSISAEVFSVLDEKHTTVHSICLGGDIRELVVQDEGVAEAEGESFLQVLSDTLDNIVPVTRQAVEVPDRPIPHTENQEGPVLFLVEMDGDEDSMGGRVKDVVDHVNVQGPTQDAIEAPLFQLGEEVRIQRYNFLASVVGAGLNHSKVEINDPIVHEAALHKPLQVCQSDAESV